MSVKLADMLAAGLPVVAEGVGQVVEYVREGRTGVVCESGAVAELVEATVGWLREAGEQGRREAARASVAERFGWGQLAGTVENIYATLSIEH